MTLWKRDVCTQLGLSSKEYGRIVNLARFYKQKNRLADHKRIRPVEHKVLSEAGFFDEKREEIEPEENPALVVLTSNIGFKFAGDDGLTLHQHARLRRRQQKLAATPVPQPELEPELPKVVAKPEPVPTWAGELRVIFQNDW